MAIGFFKAHRGKGIAKLALEKAIDWLVSEGYCRIQIDIEVSNIPSIKIAESLKGLTYEGTMKNYWEKI